MATNWKASLPKKRLSKRFKFNGGSQFLGNTGTGENNTVEPSKPTAMLNTGLGPRMVHEGEDLVKLANGDTQVIPANQSQLGQMEQQQGIPGMALGGRLRPPGGSPASGVVDVLNQTVNPTTSTDVGLNVGEPITNPTDQQTVTPLLPGQTEQNVALGLGAPVATGGASGEFQSFQPAGAQGGPPVPPTTDPLTPTGLTGIGDQAVAKGLGGLEAIAAGESPVDRTIANRTLGNLGAQQEAERMAAIQAQAQQGVTGPAAQAQQGMLGIAQGSQMGQTAGQLAIGSQERAGAAVRDMATVGLQKSQQDYTRQVDQVSTLIEAGGAENLAAAATAFGDLYGKNIDFSRLESAETAADFTTGMGNLTSFIASGQTFDEAFDGMQANGTLDLLGMNPNQARDLYDSMALNTDPVYRAMNSMDDETLATMFPDLDPAEARSTIGRMSLMGIGTFDADGKFQIDYGMLSDLGFTTGDGSGNPPNVTESEGLEAFTETIPAGKEGQWNYDKWVAAGKPTSFDSWLTSEGEAADAAVGENGTNFNELFTTTDGVLDQSADPKAVSDVVTAIQSGNQDVIDNFSTDDIRLKSLFGFAERAEDGSSVTSSILSSGDIDEVLGMVGKVIVTNSRDMIAGQLWTMNGSEPTEQEIDDWIETTGTDPSSFSDQSIRVLSATPLPDNTNVYWITMENVNTGEITKVKIGEDSLTGE